MVKEEDGNMVSWGVSRILSSLKGTFRPKEFSKLEDVLNAKEEKLRREIEKLKHEKQSFKDRYDSERLDKMNVKKELTEELKRCKMERKVFSDQVATISKENVVLRKELGKKDDEIVNLKEKYIEIESSKAAAEARIEILKKRDEELSKRVLRLENDVALLTNSNVVDSFGIRKAKENMERMENRVIVYSKKEDVEVGNDPCYDSMRRGSGGVCEGKENQQIVVRTEENAVNANGSRDAESGDGPTYLQYEGIGQHPATNALMITYIDDYHAPTGMQKGKEMTLSCSIESAHTGETVRYKKIFKRKRGSYQNSGDCFDEETSDGNACSSKNKMKLSEPISEPEKAVSCYGAETVSTPSSSRLGLGITRQYEEKMESNKLISGFPIGSFHYESDSASDSDSDSDSGEDGYSIANIDLNIYRNAYVR